MGRGVFGGTMEFFKRVENTWYREPYPDISLLAGIPKDVWRDALKKRLDDTIEGRYSFFLNCMYFEDKNDLILYKLMK